MTANMLPPDPAPHRSDVLNYEHFDCCGQGMVPKDEATQTFCPPSAVHDMIVRWDEVSEGDLVVIDGEFRLITGLIDYEGEPLMWFDGSKRGAGTFPCGTYAAVRRYDTAPAGETP